MQRNSFIYNIVSYIFVFPIFRIIFRGRTFGIDNVPSKGPLVVVANHGSHLDPPLLGHALSRPISFMAKEELFKIPILNSLIRACGAYPVKRGASDREAIREATQRLKSGDAIGVFLDGTRQRDGRVNSPLAGAALLAARSNASLLPVAIINSHRALGSSSFFPRFIPIHLRIGEVIAPPSSKRKDDLHEITLKLQSSINYMLDQGVLKASEKDLKKL